MLLGFFLLGPDDQKVHDHEYQNERHNSDETAGLGSGFPALGHCIWNAKQNTTSFNDDINPR
jgi:hypothetical protein